jgi:hypothetical protein
MSATPTYGLRRYGRSLRAARSSFCASVFTFNDTLTPNSYILGVYMTPQEYHTRLDLREVRPDRYYVAKPTGDGSLPMVVSGSISEMLNHHYKYGKIKDDHNRKRKIYRTIALNGLMTVMMCTVELPPLENP